MDVVKEPCPLYVNLISRLYYPFPWSQISHNSCSFFAHCIQVFCLVNVPDDARQKSGLCWRTHILQHVRQPAPGAGYHCSIRRCFFSSKICIFLILTGNKFHAPKHGMGWDASPFSLFLLQIAPRIHGSVKLGRRGGPIQSALRNFCPSSPKHFTPFFIIASPPTSCL